MRRGVLVGVLLVAGAMAPAAVRSADPARRVVTVHYTTRDRAAGRYQYVPFDVPPGTTRLTFAYDYDRAGGANVVDLGLFEPGSLDLGSPAFRGWSGGERKTVTDAIKTSPRPELHTSACSTPD